MNQNGGTFDPKIVRYLLGARRRRLARFQNAPTGMLIHEEKKMAEILLMMAMAFPRQERAYRRKAWQHARKAVEMMITIETASEEAAVTAAHTAN